MVPMVPNVCRYISVQWCWSLGIYNIELGLGEPISSQCTNVTAMGNMLHKIWRLHDFQYWQCFIVGWALAYSQKCSADREREREAEGRGSRFDHTMSTGICIIIIIIKYIVCKYTSVKTFLFGAQYLFLTCMLLLHLVQIHDIYYCVHLSSLLAWLWWLMLDWPELMVWAKDMHVHLYYNHWILVMSVSQRHDFISLQRCWKLQHQPWVPPMLGWRMLQNRRPLQWCQAMWGWCWWTWM